MKTTGPTGAVTWRSLRPNESRMLADGYAPFRLPLPCDAHLKAHGPLFHSLRGLSCGMNPVAVAAMGRMTEWQCFTGCCSA